MEVAIASFSGMPSHFAGDDAAIVDALGERGVAAEVVPWDRAGVDWNAYAAVVIRSTWDYARRREKFVEWCESIGDRLHNAPALVRWNSDKRYLADLGERGIPVVQTTFVGPGDPMPALTGEVVVKPNVSAGGRDSGRFGPGAHDLAAELVAAIQASGRTAMVQPYQASVDTRGETAVLCIDGEPAHALRKLAVLGRDEVAPVRDDAIGAAEVMYDPGLVTPDTADEDELELARRIIGEVERRFSYLPLYARVDMIRDEAGAPTLLELEAVEPNFYLGQVPETTEVVAEAIVARLR